MNSRPVRAAAPLEAPLRTGLHHRRLDDGDAVDPQVDANRRRPWIAQRDVEAGGRGQDVGAAGAADLGDRAGTGERPPRPVVGPGGSGPLDLRHHQQHGRDRSGEAEGEGERTPRPGPAAGDHRAGEERHVHLEGAAEARAAEAGQRGEPEVEQRPPGEQPRRRPVARHRDAQRRQDDREEPRRVDERVRRHLPGRGRRRRGGEDAVLQVAAADQAAAASAPGRASPG